MNGPEITAETLRKMATKMLENPRILEAAAVAFNHMPSNVKAAFEHIANYGDEK